MSDAFVPWLIPALALFALAMSVANALLWPRGDDGDDARRTGNADDDVRPDRVSVCIPARNEEVTLAACVRAALALDPLEVVVVDDGSTDATPRILASLAAEDPRVRVVRLDEALPPGWVGKPRACARLADVARGDGLLFLDADVVVDPSLLRRVGSLVRRFGADLVTAVPRQETVGFVERLVLPLLHVTYTSWLLLPLVWWSRDPRFLAANGQILWVRRAVLDHIGGFAAVRGEIVDDMALCRAVKRRGHRVVFADGHRMGRCRMYRSPRAVVDGFSKNLAEGTGGALGVAVVFLLYGHAFLLPWLALAAAPVVPALLLPAATGIGAALLLRLLHVVRHGSTLDSALLHPLGVVVLLWIAARSLSWSRRGTIHWAGRVYPARPRRVEMAR